MPENVDQNNSEYEHFSSSEAYISEATVSSMKKLQKQSPGVVLKKSCFENMQLIYGITPISKCDFNKVAKWRFHLQNTCGQLLPRINVTEINECNNELSEKELYMFLMSMQTNTSPGNGGLTKDFFIIL